MNGKQIDYDKIAKEYVINRSINPKVFKELYSNSRINENSTILEVGCGTGNYIGALKSITDCSCYGLELSKEMLKEAKRVSKRVNFKKGRAERIDFPESFFDFVFSIDVIHHIENIIDYFKEAYKVLKNEGKICTVTDSECIIKSRVPLSTYFPESVPYELTRYPRISILKEQMEKVNFKEITDKTVEYHYQLNDIKAYKDKAFSTLHFISEAAFNKGIKNLEKDLLKGPIPCISLYVLLWGKKA